MIIFPKVLPVIVKNRISELELLSLWDWNFLETELYNYYLKLYMYHPLFLGEWFECPCHHFYWKNSLLKCLQCLYIFITNKVHKKLKYDKYNFLQRRSIHGQIWFPTELSLVVLEGLEKLSCLAGFSFQTLSSLPAG